MDLSVFIKMQSIIIVRIATVFIQSKEWEFVQDVEKI